MREWGRRFIAGEPKNEIILEIYGQIDPLFSEVFLNPIFSPYVCLVPSSDFPVPRGSLLSDCYNLAGRDLNSNAGILSFMLDVIEEASEDCPTLHGLPVDNFFFAMFCEYWGQSGPQITDLYAFKHEAESRNFFKEQGYFLVPEVTKIGLISHSDQELVDIYKTQTSSGQ